MVMSFGGLFRNFPALGELRESGCIGEGKSKHELF
jgi:hypothetical protein